MDVHVGVETFSNNHVIMFSDQNNLMKKSILEVRNATLFLLINSSITFSVGL
jgi:hypothetical protein